MSEKESKFEYIEANHARLKMIFDAARERIVLDKHRIVLEFDSLGDALPATSYGLMTIERAAEIAIEDDDDPFELAGDTNQHYLDSARGNLSLLHGFVAMKFAVDMYDEQGNVDGAAIMANTTPAKLFSGSLRIPSTTRTGFRITSLNHSKLIGAQLYDSADLLEVSVDESGLKKTTSIQRIDGNITDISFETRFAKDGLIGELYKHLDKDDAATICVRLMNGVYKDQGELDDNLLAILSKYQNVDNRSDIERIITEVRARSVAAHDARKMRAQFGVELPSMAELDRLIRLLTL